MKTVRFAIRVSAPPRPRSTPTRATPPPPRRRAFPPRPPRRKRKVRLARDERARRPLPRGARPRRRLRRLFGVFRRCRGVVASAPHEDDGRFRRRGASRRLGLDADGAHHRARVGASVLVRVVGEESRHASRAHAESHDGDAFRASFAQRRDDGGDVARDAGGGVSLGPPGKVGVLRARVGGGLAVPRVTAVEVRDDDECAVCREPSREAASAGGAPARRVGGNHDRLLSLGVADEVGADDPALRNAGVTFGGSGGKVRRGKDGTRAATVGDDGGGTEREGTGGEASSSRRWRKCGGGERSSAREWGGRTRPAPPRRPRSRPRDPRPSSPRTRRLTSRAPSRSFGARRGVVCSQRVPCRGKPDVEPPAPAPYFTGRAAVRWCKICDPVQK